MSASGQQVIQRRKILWQGIELSRQVRRPLRRAIDDADILWPQLLQMPQHQRGHFPRADAQHGLVIKAIKQYRARRSSTAPEALVVRPAARPVGSCTSFAARKPMRAGTAYEKRRSERESARPASGCGMGCGASSPAPTDLDLQNPDPIPPKSHACLYASFTWAQNLRLADHTMESRRTGHAERCSTMARSSW